MSYKKKNLEHALSHLKEDRMRITYTEHYLEQIKIRDIPEDFVEELLMYETPTEINEVEWNSNRFELKYSSSAFGDLTVFVYSNSRFNIRLISAHVERESAGCPDNVMDFVCNIDLTSDLLDLHEKYASGHSMTISVEQGFRMDFDRCGWPIGIEMMRVSKRFMLRDMALGTAMFSGRIEIDDDFIRICVTAAPEEGISKSVEREIPNTYGFAAGIFEFPDVRDDYWIENG